MSRTVIHIRALCNESNADHHVTEWIMTYYDLSNSEVLGGAYSSYRQDRQHVKLNQIPTLGSTDFGNVSYALPALHPMFAIPVGMGEGNHTPGFATAAATIEAHAATLSASKAIAFAGWRILESESFAKQCWSEFEDKKARRE